MKKIISISILLLIISGCKQRKLELPSLTTNSCQYEESIDEVTVQARKYTNKEKAEFFNRGKHLLNGITPLHLTITNDNPEPVFLKNDFINLPLLNAKEVVKNSQGGSRGWKIAGILFLTAGLGVALWGGLALAYGVICYKAGHLLSLVVLPYSIAVLTASAILILPSSIVIHHSRSKESLKAHESRLMRKYASKDITFIPGKSTVDAVYFVEEVQMKDEFNLLVETSDQRYLQFDADLRQGHQSDFIRY